MQMIRIFFCADLASVEKALEIVWFASGPKIKLEKKKQKRSGWENWK